jgi:hypothetical protein
MNSSIVDSISNLTTVVIAISAISWFLSVLILGVVYFDQRKNFSNFLGLIMGLTLFVPSSLVCSAYLTILVIGSLN